MPESKLITNAPRITNRHVADHLPRKAGHLLTDEQTDHAQPADDRARGPRVNGQRTNGEGINGQLTSQPYQTEARDHPTNGHGEPNEVANHLKGLLNGGFGLIQGLGMSLKALFEPPVTLEYPDQRWEPAPGFRGIPVLTIDEHTDELKCVGCQACARACPPQVIHIETSRKADPDGRKKLHIDEFSIDMSRCMLCNLCVEACPFEAITMSNHYELGDYELEGIVFDKEELVKLYIETDTAMIMAGHSWQPDEPEAQE